MGRKRNIKNKEHKKVVESNLGSDQIIVNPVNFGTWADQKMCRSWDLQPTKHEIISPNLRSDKYNKDPYTPNPDPSPYTHCCIENTCGGNLVEHNQCAQTGGFCTETTWAGGCPNPG